MRDQHKRLDVAESHNPVRYTVVDTGGTTGPVDMVSTNLIEKVDAGAQLAFALYHRDPQWWKDQPLSIIKAYMRACEAYGIGGRR